VAVVRYLHLIAMAFFVGGQLFLASHYDQWGDVKLHVKLALVVVVGVLIVWHMRRPTLHAIEGAVFVVSLAIVWLGVSLAHGV